MKIIEAMIGELAQAGHFVSSLPDDAIARKYVQVFGDDAYRVLQQRWDAGDANARGTA